MSLCQHVRELLIRTERGLLLELVALDRILSTFLVLLHRYLRERKPLILIAHSALVYNLNLHLGISVGSEQARSPLMLIGLGCDYFWPNVESDILFVRMMLWRLDACRYLTTYNGSSADLHF